MSNHMKLFCSRPFVFLSTCAGKLFQCCQGWMDVPCGDLSDDPVESWNSQVAQDLRQSIFDNSFHFCKKHCPYLSDQRHIVTPVEQVTDPYLLDIIKNRKVKIDYPKTLQLASNRTCNLTCPQCRNAVEKECNELEFEVVKRLLPHIEELSMSGSGEPLMAYIDLLRSIKTEDFPRLKIYLQTNGTLLTPKMWESLSCINKSINTIHISMDAASEKTYENIRQGGKWNMLISNVEFISSLLQDGKIKELHISMVVQADNWREMKDFIRLGNKWKATCIIFTGIIDWHSLRKEEFTRRDVVNHLHPEHKLLIEYLQDPIFEEPKLMLGQFYEIRKRRKLFI